MFPAVSAGDDLRDNCGNKASEKAPSDVNKSSLVFWLYAELRSLNPRFKNIIIHVWPNLCWRRKSKTILNCGIL